MTDFRETDLTTICSGSLPELFKRELANVMANIDDQNTSPLATRKITISLKFKPDKARETVRVEADVSATMASVDSQEGFIYAVRKDGKTTAFDRNLQERELFPQKITPIGAKKGNEK